MKDFRQKKKIFLILILNDRDLKTSSVFKSKSIIKLSFLFIEEKKIVI